METAVKRLKVIRVKLIPCGEVGKYKKRSHVRSEKVIAFWDSQVTSGHTPNWKSDRIVKQLKKR